MVKIKVRTINLPKTYLAKIKELKDNEEYPSRSEFVRIALKRFLLKELMFHEKLQNVKCDISENWLKIVTVNIPESYIKTMTLLAHNTYPSVSELVRVAVHDLLVEEFRFNEDDLKTNTIQEEMESKIIRKLEFTEPKERKTRENRVYKKPKNLLKVYQYDINKNYIISFLNELNGEKKNAFELEEITGFHNSMVRHTINLILKDYPTLIKKCSVGRGIAYHLNRERLKEVMEVV